MTPNFLDTLIYFFFEGIDKDAFEKYPSLFKSLKEIT